MLSFFRCLSGVIFSTYSGGAVLSVSGSVDIHCVTFIEPFLYSRKEVNLVLVKDFSYAEFNWKVLSWDRSIYIHQRETGLCCLLCLSVSLPGMLSGKWGLHRKRWAEFLHLLLYRTVWGHPTYSLNVWKNSTTHSSQPSLL